VISFLALLGVTPPPPFGARSAHLAYLIYKSGHKTSIIIILP